MRSRQAGVSNNKDLLSIIFKQSVRVSYFLLSRLPVRQIPDRAAVAAQHINAALHKGRLELFGETFPSAYYAKTASNIYRFSTGRNPSKARKMQNNWGFVAIVLLL